MSTTFRDYFLSLSKKEQQAFADTAGTTTNYIRTHLITRYKVPRRELMSRLSAATNGHIDVTAMTNFFYADTENHHA